MATLMKGLSAPGRAKIGAADGGEELMRNQSEASDAEPASKAPAAPAGATFEAEEPVDAKKSEGGAAVAATLKAQLKGQAVTSGGPDMEKILRQGFIRKV